ncbi:MAG: alpha-1,2-fucosyltransferase [Candidatus Marinimicrobia bacterium]|nr:alpha-1,2-fucosyltransferase [Candidatus Neomarinimicrobiota bacterium]
MIIVNIKGGIGNQLYQYALARNIEIKNNYSIKFDKCSFTDYIFPHKFRLDVFNTKFDIATEEDTNKVISRTTNLKNIEKKPLYKNYGIISKALRFLYRKFDHFTYYKKSFIKEKRFTIDKKILSVDDNTYLDGYWGKYQYFEEIRDTLLDEITIKSEFATEKFIQSAQDIKKRNSVSIHIRRGYAKRAGDLKIFGVLPLSYYKKAIELINKNIKDPYFYIFSDDIEWAKENLQINDFSEFVNFGSKGDYLELLLMSYCKHNIIANSTFSWWAAWLNQNSDKTVIAPEKWYNSKKHQNFYNKGYLTPPEWMKL